MTKEPTRKPMGGLGPFLLRESLLTEKDKLMDGKNFRDENKKLFVVYCPECKKENYALAVSSGRCAWCDWGE